MYKVMLVDDEKFIRKSLLNRIPWDKWNLKVEAEAENGVEALQLMEKIRPQIVFVDIRMPLMDGLGFIQEAGKRFSDTHYIIISAYDDFNYARQAISLGVDDYILKPVKVPDVEKVLEKVMHEVSERELVRHLKEKKAPGRMDTRIIGEKISAIAFYLEECDEAEAVICAKLQENLGKRQGIHIYRIPDYSCVDCYMFLANGDTLDNHMIFEAVTEVWSVFPEREGTSAWSEIVRGAEIGAAVRECVNLLKNKIFYPERKILRRDIRGKEQEQIEEENLNQVRHIYDMIYRQMPNPNHTVVRGELVLLPDLIVNRNHSISMMENCIMELIIILKRVIRQEMDELETDILFRHMQEKDYLLSYRTEEELKNTLKKLICYVCETREKEERKELVTQIKEYIRNNYSENLSATEIAGVFFLNTSYLSTLFREKAGMTMKTYIEAVRMEKAKQMLMNKELSVTEVAAYTGYSDPNYFSKVFRKYTGMSPRGYRDEMDVEKL